jgi:hypothetical protein
MIDEVRDGSMKLESNILAVGTLLFE